MPRRVLALNVALLGLLAPVVLACPGPPPPEDPGGPDLFRLAVNGAPGGALLAAWGEDRGRRAFLAGGYVGLDPAAAPDGRAGRLVEYTRGRFETRCASDRVLWWVHGAGEGAEAVVYAAGEEGRVVRYRGGRCEALTVDLAFEGGAPTLWGVYARAPDDVWFVGGAAHPTGPRGVVVRYDGARFARVAGGFEAARGQNLYKIDRRGADFVVVGAGGLVLHHSPASGAWTPAVVDLGTRDDRLFTVSCASAAVCYAVGGAASGVALRVVGSGYGWTVVVPSGELPGLNGVWARPDGQAFMVGVGGLTMHTTGTRSYRPPAALTEATLHGVGGFGEVVLAVGGELDERSPAQRGVVLVRGDDSARFTFDGRTYEATGSLRRSLGGSGQ